MGMLDSFPKAPSIRPLLNLGCLLDIPTGRYIQGKHGEYILNGGLSYLTGIGGRGNTYKSTFAHFMMLRCLDRYLQSEGFSYDTEISLTTDRMTQLARDMPHIGGVDLADFNRYRLIDKTVMMGNKWFDEYRKAIRARLTNAKDHKLTTPFVNNKGEQYQAFNPFLGEVDSLSQMDIEAVETMYDNNEVGDAKLNTEALKGAAAKSQMITQLPGLTGSGGGYLILTAHLGDEHQLDPYAPPAKKLTFLKGKVKFKRVPENFTFLTNNCWLCLNASVLMNKTNKTPEFPRSKDDDLKGDTDLMVITVQNVRAKSGPTGMPLDIVVSQRDGVQVGLTEFLYIKNNNRYGLGGHDRSYYLELVPDITLQRTTVRGKIAEEPRLQRALEITSELCQMRNLWHDMEPGLLIEPKELYEKLKAKGYDWDVLLNTRGYWMFEEDVTDDTLPFLSTRDLLEMAADRYTPWWYDKVAKSKAA